MDKTILFTVVWTKEKKYFHNKCQEHLCGNCDFEKHRQLFSHRRCHLFLDNHLVLLRPTKFVSLEGVITVIGYNHYIFIVSNIFNFSFLFSDILIPLYVPTACINNSCLAVECWRFQNQSTRFSSHHYNS